MNAEIQAGSERAAQHEIIVSIKGFEKSYPLTKRINMDRLGTGPAKAQLDRDIPESIRMTLTKGSEVDRDKYWTEKAPNKTYGQTMVEWMRGGETGGGLSSWVDAQTTGDNVDPDVKALLKSVSLVGDGPKDRTQIDQSVKDLIARINDSLPAGQTKLNIDNPDDPGYLSDTDLRVLTFYDSYLDASTDNAENEGTAQLMNHLVSAVTYDLDLEHPSEESITAAFAKLDKIAPLLRVTGEDAQYAFGAVMAAKIHSEHESGKVEHAGDTEDSMLKPHEKKALTFLSQHRGESDSAVTGEDDAAEDHRDKRPKVEPLQPDEHYQIEAIMGMVTDPPATSERNPYWVGALSSGDIAGDLGQLRLGELKRVEPFWTFELDSSDPSGRAVRILTQFEPAHTFDPKADNPSSRRFVNLELLTKGDSGLLALAGVIAETPAQQAEVFKALGRAVLEVHKANPTLLGEFLTAQQQVDPATGWSAQERFRQFEAQRQSEVLEQVALFVFDQNGINLDNDIRAQLQALDEAKAEAMVRSVGAEQNNYLNASLAQSPDKLFALQFVQNPQNPNGNPLLVINPQATVDQWTERLSTGELESALDSGELTVEQIRQIEFLSHAVKITGEDGLIKWLQDRAQSQSPDSGEPGDGGPEAPAPGEEGEKKVTLSVTQEVRDNQRYAAATTKEVARANLEVGDKVYEVGMTLGDITEADVASIIVPASGVMTLTGQVGRAVERTIKEIAGTDSQAQQDALQPFQNLAASVAAQPLPSGSLSIIDSPQLQSGRGIDSVIVLNIHPSADGGPIAEQFSRMVASALAAAAEKGIKSVAIPELGTGNLGGPFGTGFESEDTWKIILQGYGQYLQMVEAGTAPGTVEKISIVSYKAREDRTPDAMSQLGVRFEGVISSEEQRRKLEALLGASAGTTSPESTGREVAPSAPIAGEYDPGATGDSRHRGQ